MTKAQIADNNVHALSAWRKACKSMEVSQIQQYSRLRTCTAWVYVNSDYYFLMSYNTIVAAVRKSDGLCIDALRFVYGYTATSAQHISKFFHDFAPYTYYTNSIRYIA